MTVCPALASDGAFLSSLLRHIDCQGQTIGAAGYQVLADPASPISIAFTGVLTIFIALFGLRMMMGSAPGLREGVVAVVKIGIVLLIATSWPAYRTVFYDVVVHGPAELSRSIGTATGLPGANGDLTTRLQRADLAIVRLTTLGSGRSDLTSQPATGANGAAASLERAPITDDLALGSARIAFLSSIVAAFALVQLGAGLLLALAPLFAGLLLFDMARGLFVGWLRALAFTMLASVAVTMILGVELALLEPWLSRTLQLRYARVIAPSAPVELLVLCLAFAIALAGAMALILRLAFMLHIQFDVQKLLPLREMAGLSEARGAVAAPASDVSNHTRAVAVASAVAAAQRRENAVMAYGSPLRRPRLIGSRSQIPSPYPGDPASGASLRRTRPRKSLASTLRDRRP